MNKSTITREIIFHSGHMLKDDQSKCHNPHGHEYVLQVSVTGPIQISGNESGMVMHFGTLKELLMRVVHDRFDHKFIVQESDPRFKAFAEAVNWGGVISVPYTPTAENLTSDIYHALCSEISMPFYISKIRLQETSNCWVENLYHDVIIAEPLPNRKPGLPIGL